MQEKLNKTQHSSACPIGKNISEQSVEHKSKTNEENGMKFVGAEIVSTLEALTLKGAEHEYKPCSAKK